MCSLVEARVPSFHLLTRWQGHVPWFDSPNPVPRGSLVGCLCQPRQSSTSLFQSCCPSIRSPILIRTMTIFSLQRREPATIQTTPRRDFLIASQMKMSFTTGKGAYVRTQQQTTAGLPKCFTLGSAAEAAIPSKKTDRYPPRRLTAGRHSENCRSGSPSEMADLLYS